MNNPVTVPITPNPDVKRATEKQTKNDTALLRANGDEQKINQRATSGKWQVRGGRPDWALDPWPMLSGLASEAGGWEEGGKGGPKFSPAQPGPPKICRGSAQSLSGPQTPKVSSLGGAALEKTWSALRLKKETAKKLLKTAKKLKKILQKTAKQRLTTAQHTSLKHCSTNLLKHCQTLIKQLVKHGYATVKKTVNNTASNTANRC